MRQLAVGNTARIFEYVPDQGTIAETGRLGKCFHCYATEPRNPMAMANHLDRVASKAALGVKVAIGLVFQLEMQL